MTTPEEDGAARVRRIIAERLGPGANEEAFRKTMARTLAGDIVHMIKDAFPGMSPEKALTEHVIPALMEVPEWVHQAGGIHIGQGTIFNAGAFCIYWGEDPDTKKIMAVLHVRKERGEKGEPKFGAIGGYTIAPEQSFVGVLRESVEEACHADGTPAIVPEISKYTYLFEGSDFDRKPPVKFTAYAYHLSPEEMSAMKKYAARFNDESFRKAVTHASGGETLGIKCLPLEEIIAIHPNQFMYQRQYDTFREVAARLGVGCEQTKPSSPVGFAIGDSPQLFVGRIRHGDQAIDNPRSPF